MNVTSHLNNKTNNIIVLGELKQKNEKEKLVYEINKEDVEEVIISFVDARVLDGEGIILLLDTMKAKDKVKFKIITTHSYLYSYLLKLGIKNVFYENKSSSKLDSRSLYNKNYYFQDEDFINFIKKINETYGYDFNNYNKDSIKRRIHSAMIRINVKDFDYFSKIVLSDPDSFEELFIELSINVTEFFRDRDTFYIIRNRVLPYLKSFLHVNIWCAGCSTGEEPYSLAILFSELGMLDKCQIYATDINPFVIEEAKNGLYSAEAFEDFNNSYNSFNGKRNFKEYFDKKEEIYCIKKNIKEKVLFFQHNLLDQGIINEFQLILCRNVLIYFDSELQERVLLQFNKSLDRNGFLVLGKSETILSSKVESLYKTIDKECKIYKKSVY